MSLLQDKVVLFRRLHRPPAPPTPVAPLRLGAISCSAPTRLWPSSAAARHPHGC